MRGRELSILTASTLDLHWIHLEIIFFNMYIVSTDIDDFIVDDDGQPITKGRGKKFSGYTDA